MEYRVTYHGFVGLWHRFGHLAGDARDANWLVKYFGNLEDVVSIEFRVVQ